MEQGGDGVDIQHAPGRCNHAAKNFYIARLLSKSYESGVCLAGYIARRGSVRLRALHKSCRSYRLSSDWRSLCAQYSLGPTTNLAQHSILNAFQTRECSKDSPELRLRWYCTALKIVTKRRSKSHRDRKRKRVALSLNERRQTSESKSDPICGYRHCEPIQSPRRLKETNSFGLQLGMNTV
jgi:hypothetical protein